MLPWFKTLLSLLKLFFECCEAQIETFSTYDFIHTRKTVFILTTPATPVHSHLKLHNKCSLCLCREYNSLEEMSRLLASDCDLTAKRPVVSVRHVFMMGCLVWPLGVLSAQRRLTSGSVLTIYCTNVAICSDQKSTVCMLFPASELIWLFPQITPLVVFGCPK